MPDRPKLPDYEAWCQLIMERRRILLERFIAEYPDVLKTHKSTIENLRLRIRSILI
jgi:hypothetical protein